MKDTPSLYDTLVQVLRQHEKWLDVRHTKTLAWMIVGLIESGPHWFRGASYLKIGWAWVKKAIRRHWPLLTHLALPGEPDPEPAIASRKQLTSYRGPCFSVEFLR